MTNGLFAGGNCTVKVDVENRSKRTKSDPQLFSPAQRPSQLLFLSVGQTEMASMSVYAETCSRYLERIGDCGSFLSSQGELAVSSKLKCSSV